jgi:YesN/AraC family two-component response regulator
MEYLNRYRVEQAKRLLEASSKSVEQISRSVGFPDPNYFTKIFARYTGTSPREFRNQSQTESATTKKT